MNVQKLTQKSMEAVQLAQNIAEEHDNQQIEQCHVLLALMMQDGGLVPQLLTKMGVTAESVTAAAQRRVPVVGRSAMQVKHRCGEGSGGAAACGNRVRQRSGQGLYQP